MSRLILISASMLVCLVAACTGDGTTDSSAATLPSTSASETSVSVPTSTEPETTTTSTTFAAVDSSHVVLDAGPAALGPIAGAVGADGFPLVAYVASDGELRLLLCSDVNCEGPLGQVAMDDPGEHLDLDLAVGVDGSPVVVINVSGSDAAFLYWCSDPACTSVETVPIVDAEGVRYPSIVVGSDGLASVGYITSGDPVKVKVATCGRDLDICDGWALIDVLPSQVFTGAPSVRLDVNDRLFLGYWYSHGYETQESRVTVCPDAHCDEGNHETLVFEGGVFPQTTSGDAEDSFHLWYQTGSESLPIELLTDEALEEGAAAFPAIWSEYSDFLVAPCTPEGCDEPRHVPPGEDWLLPQAAGGFRLFTTGDNTTGAFFNHASRDNPIVELHVTICNDAVCTDGTTRTLGVNAIEGWLFDVITRPAAPPQVVFRSTDEAIELYNCSADTCTP